MDLTEGSIREDLMSVIVEFEKQYAHKPEIAEEARRQLKNAKRANVRITILALPFTNEKNVDFVTEDSIAIGIKEAIEEYNRINNRKGRVLGNMLVYALLCNVEIAIPTKYYSKMSNESGKKEKKIHE